MIDRKDDEPELRWMETPTGRGVINCVTLIVLLSMTQHFGFIAPGPPVRLDNFLLYVGYGVAVGLIMYLWTYWRLRRQRGRREVQRRAAARADAYEAEDQAASEADKTKDGSA